ncbi:DsrE family protein [Varunaivibrio sulfuroxidans]|uniref:Uncharacterized protein n=1 Tax=Varunaivibrio sulfuroxidans TaxID=1773489 RepID=A0A4R3JE07_9PROT|nr:DsrE family protein [Varunaivibrio sulfuroxidans]TCS64299.1 hypothetical protein EDD55_102342 [Varunaivibrio sulfuroxidans]WES31265.1 DsrE family protein [Varunaivibrio sulfuroxidans]
MQFRQWVGVFLVFVACGISTAKAQEFADPQPTMDNPRRIVLGVDTKDVARLNNILYNTVNLQKNYGQDNVEIAIIAYGPGVRMLLKGSPVAERVRSLMMYGVKFIACQNTMDTLHKTKADLIDGVSVVRSGLAEIVERRLKGWVDIKP